MNTIAGACSAAESNISRIFTTLGSPLLPLDAGCRQGHLREASQAHFPPARDTTWSQQGTTGRLEKNGAVLTSESGRKAYLLADPVSGAVVGYNPLPDAQSWTLTTRDGSVVRPDGKVGLLRVEYRPWAGEYEIDYAPKPEQNGANMARNLMFTGCSGGRRCG